LFFSAGLVISLHYCGGNLAALKLFSKASCCCDDEESDEQDDCCKNEFKPIKIVDDQYKEDIVTVDFKPVVVVDVDLLPMFSFDFTLFIYSPSIEQTQRLPKPPDQINLIPAYKRFHSYLFYS